MCRRFEPAPDHLLDSVFGISDPLKCRKALGTVWETAYRLMLPFKFIQKPGDVLDCQLARCGHSVGLACRGRFGFPATLLGRAFKANRFESVASWLPVSQS